MLPCVVLDHVGGSKLPRGILVQCLVNLLMRKPVVVGCFEVKRGGGRGTMACLFCRLSCTLLLFA